VLAAGLAVLWPTALFVSNADTASAGTTPVIAAQVTTTQVGQVMPPGFVGLSLEYHALHVYVGRNPAAINPVFVALTRALAPGNSPILRIGGDSTDQTWWPEPGVIPPGGITYNLTGDWLRVAHQLAAELNARLILGINFAADSPALAATEARALIQGIGMRYIDALEIGNEADVYTEFPWYRDSLGNNYYARPLNYNFSDFIAEFSRWRSALPPAPIAGPAFASTDWMGYLHTFLADEQGMSLITFHRYPLRGCEPNATAPDYASIPNLLSDGSSSGLAESVAEYVAIAHADGVPFRIDELNSAACTGKYGVSNTFASSLWVLDTLFNMAEVGVDGVNIHTLPGAAYAPFSFRQKGSQWTGYVHPLYYGLLMFEQAFPAGAHLVQVNVPTGPVEVWATRTAAGQTRVVVINKDPLTAAEVHLQLPDPTTPLVSEPLIAPSLTSTTGVTLGGESFGASTTTGVLPANPAPLQVTASNGYFSVTVPAASALLLTQ
jgi:hypothetical protein